MKNDIIIFVWHECDRRQLVDHWDCVYKRDVHFSGEGRIWCLSFVCWSKVIYHLSRLYVCVCAYRSPCSVRWPQDKASGSFWPSERWQGSSISHQWLWLRTMTWGMRTEAILKSLNSIEFIAIDIIRKAKEKWFNFWEFFFSSSWK